MIPKAKSIVISEIPFQQFFKKLFFVIFINSPFDPIQVLILLMIIVTGTYLIKRKKGFGKIVGKIIALIGLTVLTIRILVVLYLATQI